MKTMAAAEAASKRKRRDSSHGCPQVISPEGPLNWKRKSWVESLSQLRSPYFLIINFILFFTRNVPIMKNHETIPDLSDAKSEHSKYN